MGEVYRAHDTRLKREVAIKTLPEEFSRDPERLLRFQREAEALAALNHPNIGSIYHLQESGGSRYLVLELVEGDTLADLLAKRGALSVEEAIRIAKQICEGLEAAHEKGIAHRDLKPANIKVTADGKVKLLDFGLARTLEPPANANLSNSPTIMGNSTPGVILGTAAYMSPEQAKGEAIDKRSDIWAFGCVLYEMITGRPVFEANTLTELLAAVIYKDINWTALPPSTPANVQTVLHRCLQRDRFRRLRDIGDAQIELDAASTFPAQTSRRRPLINRWAAPLGVSIATIALLIIWFRPDRRPTTATPVALSIAAPTGTSLKQMSGFNPPEISPDGTSVLFIASNGANLRRLDSFQSVLVPALKNTTGNGVYWTPDSKSVAVIPILPGPGRQLIKVHVPDGSPEPLAPLPGYPRGVSFSDNGDVLISSVSSGGELGLFTTHIGDRELKPVNFEGKSGGSYLWPEFLPGTSDFLVFFDPDSGRGSADRDGEIWLATLRDGKATNSSLLVQNETAARFTPAGGGRLLFVHADKLYAQRLDRKLRKVAGEAELIDDGVASVPRELMHRAEFSVSRTGTVAFLAGQASSAEIATFDRTGKRIGTVGQAGDIDSLALSPDETRILTSIPSETWLFDLSQPGVSILKGPWHWSFWSPDGLKVFGQQRPSRGLAEMSLSGSGAIRIISETLGQDKAVGALSAISPDGHEALFASNSSGMSSVTLDGPSFGPRKLGEELAYNPGFSPDGHWIVYSISQQGIFVQPYPSGVAKRVSNFGTHPFWRRDGKEIVYVSDDALGGWSVWSVVVESSAIGLRFGAPAKLFDGVRLPSALTGGSRPLAISRDGSRIYLTEAVEQPNSNVIQIRMGWFNPKPQ
jgi:serine/threonine protein kinase